MSGTRSSEQPDLSALVEEITALAEQARVQGAAFDCAVRMDALIARHRARIEAARRIEAEGDVTGTIAVPV